MSRQASWSLWSIGAGLSILVVAGAASVGCATAPSDGVDGDRAASGGRSEASAASFGADPMGVAREWAAGAGDKWREPVVSRLYRDRADRYRAVVTERTDGDRAVLLTIRPAQRSGDRREGRDWRVSDVEQTDPRHLWPSF